MTTYKYLNTSAHFLGVGRPLATLSTPAQSSSNPLPDLGTAYIPGVMSALRIRVRCFAKEAKGQELPFHVERNLLKTSLNHQFRLQLLDLAVSLDCALRAHGGDC